MKSFSRSWLDGLELYWSWTMVLVCFVICAIMSLVLLVIFMPLFETFNLLLPLAIGGISYVLIIAAYGFVYYGSEIKLWNGKF